MNYYGPMSPVILTLLSLYIQHVMLALQSVIRAHTMSYSYVHQSTITGQHSTVPSFDSDIAFGLAHLVACY